MITIQTKEIKKYEKILFTLFNKSGIEDNSLYLNFQDSYIYFITDKFTGRLKFKFTKDGNDQKLENFYINIYKFLTLISAYTEILWDSNKKIFINPNNENEIFKLEFTKEETTFNNLFNNMEDATESFKVDKLIFDHIKDSFPFMGTDIYDEYNSIFIGNKKIVSTNRYKFYEGYNIPVNDKFFLQSDIIRILLLCDVENNILISVTANVIILSLGGDDLKIIFAKKANSQLPPIEDAKFIDSYNHKSSFICNGQELHKILIFLDIFNKNYVNQRVFLTIKTKDQAEIMVEESDKVIRTLNIKNVTNNTVGLRVCLSLPYIKTVLSVLKTDNIMIQLDATKPALNFTEISDNDLELKRHLIIVRLEEE